MDRVSADEMPSLTNPAEEFMNKLNGIRIRNYNKNDIVLAQLQKVVDETNVRNMWRRGEVKLD